MRSPHFIKTKVSQRLAGCLPPSSKVLKKEENNVWKKKQKKAQGGVVFLSVGCFITVSASHHHLSDIQKRLIMLSSALPLSCISAFDSAQEAEITWTVSYLYECFVIRLGFSSMLHFSMKRPKSVAMMNSPCWFWNYSTGCSCHWKKETLSNRMRWLFTAVFLCL